MPPVYTHSITQLDSIFSTSVPDPDCVSNPVLGQRSTILPPPPIPVDDVEAVLSDHATDTDNFIPKDQPDNATPTTPTFLPPSPHTLPAP